MSDALFARGQMGLSLAFHIIFAAVGITMPALMVGAEIRWRQTGDAEWLALAKRWAKGTAVFFAVGAVSGTALSFELGLLFPGFMRHAGAVLGMPFSLEGFAFFTEAIFLGIYLYGWERVPPRAHIAAGVVVAASGALSAVFVTIANAWMNAPRGFRVEDGRFVDIDPLGILESPMIAHEVVHGLLAAYMATSLAVAGLHARALRRDPTSTLHRKALAATLALAIPVTLAQPLVGHAAGQVVALHQPAKLAAMERHIHTRARAPMRLGPIEIPAMLSILAFNDPDAVVIGLEEFPREDWPSPWVKPAFLVMVGLGTIAAGWAALAALLWVKRRGRVPDNPLFLLATMAVAPAGYIALEAGWTVTELGRQPWVVYNVLRTNDTVTPMPGLWLPFTLFALLYLALTVVVTVVLVRQIRADDKDLHHG